MSSSDGESMEIILSFKDDDSCYENHHHHLDAIIPNHPSEAFYRRPDDDTPLASREEDDYSFDISSCPRTEGVRMKPLRDPVTHPGGFPFSLRQGQIPNSAADVDFAKEFGWKGFNGAASAATDDPDAKDRDPIIGNYLVCAKVPCRSEPDLCVTLADLGGCTEGELKSTIASLESLCRSPGVLPIEMTYGGWFYRPKSSSQMEVVSPSIICSFPDKDREIAWTLFFFGFNRPSSDTPPIYTIQTTAGRSFEELIGSQGFSSNCVVVKRTSNATTSDSNAGHTVYAYDKTIRDEADHATQERNLTLATRSTMRT